MIHAWNSYLSSFVPSPSLNGWHIVNFQMSARNPTAQRCLPRARRSYIPSSKYSLSHHPINLSDGTYPHLSSSCLFVYMFIVCLLYWNASTKVLGKGTGLYNSPLYPQLLKQCWAYSECLINIYLIDRWMHACMDGCMDGWMNACMDAWMHGMYACLVTLATSFGRLPAKFLLFGLPF